MGGGPATHGTFQTGHTTHAAAALRTTTHLQTGKTICCNLTSSAPDDGAYAPETCRAKETSVNYIVASSWHFTLFDEDARSNNPRLTVRIQTEKQTIYMLADSAKLQL